MYLSRTPMGKVYNTSSSRAVTATNNMPQQTARQSGVSLGHPVDMRMFPWLLPVSVAVVMVIFLVCSFFNHHRRFLQQRRHASRYYLHEYRRVAGPIFTLAATLGAAPGESRTCGGGGGVGEQEDQPTSILTTSALTKRLRRCYSWSPRIFKTKHSPGVHGRAGLASIRKNGQLDSRSSLGSVAHSLVSNSQELREDPALSAKILAEIQTTLQKSTGVSEENLNAQLYALAHWASLSQSTRRKSRSLVVTTSSGALAKDHRQSNPDVTSLKLGEPRFETDSGGTSRFSDGHCAKYTTQNRRVSELPANQNGRPEYLSSNHIEDDPQFISWKSGDSFQYPGIPDAFVNIHTNSTSDVVRSSADAVPTIQITPTADEAEALSMPTPYIPLTCNTNEGEKNNNNVISSPIYDVKKGSKLPTLSYDCNSILHIATDMSDQSLTRVNAKDNVPRDPIPDKTSVRSFHGSLKKPSRHASLNRSRDSHQYQSDVFVDEIVSTQPQSLANAPIPFPSLILTSIRDLQRVIRKLRDVVGLESYQCVLAGKKVEETVRCCDDDSEVKVAKMPLVEKEKEQRSRYFDVSLKRDQSKNSGKTVSVKRCVKKNTQNLGNGANETEIMRTQSFCKKCERVRDILEDLEPSTLQSIDHFLAQDFIQGDLHTEYNQSTSNHNEKIDACKNMARSKESQGQRDKMARPRDFKADEVFNAPLLSGRRRAASESSAVTQCPPLMRQRKDLATDNVCIMDPSRPNVRAKHASVEKMAETVGKVKIGEAFGGDPGLVENREEGPKDSAKARGDVVECRPLSDSPSSICNVEEYKDSSLASLHESMI